MNEQRPIRTFEFEGMEPQRIHKYLLNSIAPRPICFASTVDAQGRVNLSPFSFYNVFSSNPPIVIFSPSRRGRDNSTKHSYENILEVPEVTINAVSYALVNQTSLASSDYPKGTNEFQKAGLTEVPSIYVRPPRVKEAPVSMECRVESVIPLGDGPGAGNLILSRVLCLHVYEDLLDGEELPDPELLDLVGRHGGNWYTRTHAAALFEVEKPSMPLGMGVDALPESIRLSPVLTGNQLGILANVPQPPTASEATAIASQMGWDTMDDMAAHRLAGALLDEGRVAEAWALLIYQHP